MFPERVLSCKQLRKVMSAMDDKFSGIVGIVCLSGCVILAIVLLILKLLGILPR